MGMLWDLSDGKFMISLNFGGPINSVIFHPTRTWLCVATDASIQLVDIETSIVLDERNATFPLKMGVPWCVSLQWSAEGNMLFAGLTDGNIYVYKVEEA